MRRLFRRAWETIAEPRVMSALAMVSYVLLFVSSVIVDLGSSGSVAVIVCDVLVKLGAVIGFVAAWRGNREVELPGAALCGLGGLALAILAVSDGVLHEAWPGWHVVTALATCSFLGQRAYYLHRHARNVRADSLRGEMEGLERARGLARALMDELGD